MSVRVKSPNLSYKIKTPPRVVSPTTFTTSSTQDSRPKSPLQTPRLISNVRPDQVSPVSKPQTQPPLSQRLTESAVNKTQIYIRSREISPGYSLFNRRNTPVHETAPEMTVSELKAEIKESHIIISKLRAQNISLSSDRDIIKEAYNSLLIKFEEAKESMKYLTCTLTDIITCIIQSNTRSSDLILNTKINLISNIQNAMITHIEQIAKTSGEEFTSEVSRISNWTHSQSTDTLLNTGNFCDFLAQYNNSIEDEMPIVSIREGSFTERAGRESFNCDIPNELLYDSFVLGSKDSYPRISVKNLPSSTDEITPLTDTKVIFNQRTKINRLNTRSIERKTNFKSKYEVKENVSYLENTSAVLKNLTDYRSFENTLNRALLTSNTVRNR